MMNKPYKLGLIIGRFQPLHSGHEFMIRQALNVCDEVVIVIGSAQESGTERNPLSLKDRIDIIVSAFAEEITTNRIRIIGLNDREQVVNDSSWGEYVLNALKQHNIDTPDCVIEGNEPERETWYDTLGINRFVVDRNTVNISATKIRELVINNNYSEWEQYCPSNFYPEKLFAYLRKILKNIKK